MFSVYLFHLALLDVPILTHHPLVILLILLHSCLTFGASAAICQKKKNVVKKNKNFVNVKPIFRGPKIYRI